MAGHQNKVQLVCRLCQYDVSQTKHYNLLTSDWLCDFINNHVFQNNFHTEDKGRYSSLICKSCFNKLSQAKTKENNHVQKEKKLPKARRTDFKVAIDIAIVDDKNWDHKEDNCKLCGTAQREEPLDTPHCESKQQDILSEEAAEIEPSKSCPEAILGLY